MATGNLDVVLRHLRRLTAKADASKLSDQELLERFVRERSGGAFEAIVGRHGPMVLGVCRRILWRAEDVEDAFQATFLVLVRKAASIRRQGSVRNWLYGVAYRTAARAKVEAAKRRARETQAPARAQTDPLADITVRELQSVLDAELHRLPVHYRAPLLLCYLEGRTRDEAAAELGWSLGTLARRLEHGRKLLRSRLGRQGLALPVALAALHLQGSAQAAVPTALLISTVKAASLLAAGQAAAGLISVNVAALTEGVLKTMLLSKIKAVMGVLLLVGISALGIAGGGWAYQTRTAERPDAYYGEPALVRVAEGAKPSEKNTPAQGTEKGPKDAPAPQREAESPKDNADPQGAQKAKLLYPSNRDGNLEILLINADGSDPINLTDNPASDTDPAWSPDGKKIAFTSDRNGSPAIYVMDADGRNVVQLTKEENVVDRTPAWSPDGKKIAFCRQLDNDWEVFVMDADGSNQTNLTNAPRRNADPAWSRDGKKIAFASSRNGKGYSVYVMDADGSNVQDLTQSENPKGYVYPAWSPDGKKIAYTDVVDDALEIFVCDVDGSNKNQLTKEGGHNTHAAWSPDGKRIAFQHFQPNEGTASLYIMEANGDNPKEVLKNEGPVEGGRPSWKPK